MMPRINGTENILYMEQCDTLTGLLILTLGLTCFQRHGHPGVLRMDVN